MSHSAGKIKIETNSVEGQSVDYYNRVKHNNHKTQ